ncbi:ras GEF [Auricularia subglabra TFB-10046 SS5]|nr:ras GEF [Auricularia subglabra TFB-10046 SS5]
MTPSPRSPPGQSPLRRHASASARVQGTGRSRSPYTTSPVQVPETFLVSCLHNFRPTDPDQLPFRKGDVLEIVRKDPHSGWWAAKFLTENRVGWIPRDFVKRVARDLELKDVIEGFKSAGVDVPDVLESAALAPTAAPSASSAPDGEIVFKDALSPSNVLTAREFPTPVTPLPLEHPFRTATRVFPQRRRRADDDIVRDFAMIMSAESDPLPIPELSSSSSGSSTIGGTGGKGKLPLKLNTNLVVQPVPSQRQSPLSFADVLELSPTTFSDWPAHFPGFGNFRISGSESSGDGPRTPSPSHPFASAWAARTDAAPRSAPIDMVPMSARSSPTPSSVSTPPPSPPPQTQAHGKLPVNRGRSSTVADPPASMQKPVIVTRPHANSVSAAGPVPPTGRARSKSALGMAPTTLAGVQARPLRIVPEQPARRMSVQQLSPRTSAPDLKLAASLPARLSPLNRARRGSDKILQLTGDPGAQAFARMGMDPLDEDPEAPRPGPSRVRGGGDKVMQLTGDPQAAAIIDARARVRNMPWYLRPAYLEGRDIQTDTDGNVKAGTIVALQESLISEPLVEGQDKGFRDVFLKTFKSFTTAEDVFSSLEQHFNIVAPDGLDESQMQRWLEERAKPVQLRVLEVLRCWLEEHHMLQEDAEIASRMQEFLAQIRSPPAAALSARQILLSMERLISSPGETVPIAPAFPSVSRRRARPQQPVNDIFKIDALVLAQQLTIHESLLYSRIRPQECVRYLKDQKGPGTTHLRAFCGTNDKIAALVKSTVLDIDNLHKRADALEYWIKVASKCHSMNNISSMSAIVAALTSADLSRLSRTWNEVSSSVTKTFQHMQKFNDPTANYSVCRQFIQEATGPCVPFIAMYLRDLLHLNERLPDNLVAFLSPLSATRSSPATTDGPAFINFWKRRQLAQTINAMLKHQGVAYAFGEDAVTMSFLQERMALAAATDRELFWKRSQEIRQAEAAFGDIKKQMEWAGF